MRLSVEDMTTPAEVRPFVSAALYRGVGRPIGAKRPYRLAVILSRGGGFPGRTGARRLLPGTGEMNHTLKKLYDRLPVAAQYLLFSAHSACLDGEAARQHEDGPG